LKTSSASAKWTPIHHDVEILSQHVGGIEEPSVKLISESASQYARSWVEFCGQTGGCTLWGMPGGMYSHQSAHRTQPKISREYNPRLPLGWSNSHLFFFHVQDISSPPE
jgi:hypothetical protein